MRKHLMFLISLSALVNAFGQTNLKLQTKIPYYINVNNASGESVYDIQEGYLSLEYMDNVGITNEMELTIYNWKSEALGSFKLDKVSGLNHYSFEFTDIGIQPEVGSIYRCVIIDENKNKYEWSVRNNKRPEDNKPAPLITVNPISMNCEDPQGGSIIQFYGSISGGKGPYVLNWYVINEGKTDFLYQPKEENVQQAGIISSIMVDKNPAYYVMVLVTDACGNVGKQMVFISCQESDKKINTIFVEPLSGLNAISAPTKIN